MYATMLYLATLEGKQRFENDRKKWTDFKDSKEYLFVECTCCGQAYPRQKVLRFYEGDFKEWMNLAGEDEKAKRKTTNFIRLGMLVALVSLIAAACAAIISKSIFTAIVVCVAVNLIGGKIVSIPAKKAAAKTKERKIKKERIIKRYGDMPLEKVGILNNYRAEFVILIKI